MVNMAWIESHQALERHPKTIKLMQLMNWDLDTTLGKLHRFWWWCLDYAENGDLTKFDHNQIASAVSVNGDGSKAFLDAMITAGWIDENPYLRVHDWWDYIGLFLQRRYGKKEEKWKGVQLLYNKCTIVSTTNHTNHTVPNHTVPNHTNHTTPTIPNHTITQETVPRQCPNDVKTVSGSLPDLAWPILYLNEKTGRKYDAKNKGNQEFIKARYSEGRTQEDFKIVIDKKVAEWLSDEKMAKYLRPETLFNRTKFESYLNEPIPIHHCERPPPREYR